MSKRILPLVLSLLIVFPLLTVNARETATEDSLISVKTARSLLLKSIVLPGWGEHSLKYHKRGYALNSSELFLWASYAALLYFGNSAEQDMQAYAATHAGINTRGKDVYYYTDIGNYNTIYEYNDQKLRYRQYAALYPDTDEYYWAWDSDASRQKFDKLRYDSQQLLHMASFALGGLILNRIVSMIDVIALTKDRLETPVSDVQALILPGRNTTTFSLSIGLK